MAICPNTIAVSLFHFKSVVVVFKAKKSVTVYVKMVISHLGDLYTVSHLVVINLFVREDQQTKLICVATVVNTKISLFFLTYR